MGSIITLSIVQSALELGFIYALVALALFVSFSILDIADLSTDGCFTLGCAVFATVTLAGHPVLGLFAAAAAGVVSGFVTAFLQTRMGIQSILAGIIVNTGLYTINIAVMGFASNINLFSCDTVFSWAKDHIGGTWYKLIVAAVFVVIVGVILAWFLNTRLGLSIRATGDNPDMVRASSINTGLMITIGLCVANAMTGLSGGHRKRRCVKACDRRGIRKLPVPLYRSDCFKIKCSGRMFKTGIITYRCICDRTALSEKAGSVYETAPPCKGRKPVIYGTDPETEPEEGGTVMLIMKNVSKTFNPGTVNEKCALKNLNLELKNGDFATIIGSNGAGKSTLFNAITGAFFIDRGLIVLDGEDITYQKEHVRSKVIGHLFQDPLKGTAPHMTIEENMALAYLRAKTSKNAYFSRINAADKAKFREHLALLDMGLEDRMKQPVGLLSGGQRQALTLLMATMVTPKILLLDEHTAALDPATAKKVLDLTRQIVAERKITCLMVTHNMHQALELGNRTLMMDSGNIILDVSGEKRAGMTVEDLLEQFAVCAGKRLDNDRILFSQVE